MARIAPLARAVAKARGSIQSGALPQSLWGHQSVGIAPTKNNKISICDLSFNGIIMSYKSYLTIEGTAEYGLAVQKLLFGSDAEIITSQRAKTAQAPGASLPVIDPMASVSSCVVP